MKKDLELTQVNMRLFFDDVEFIKLIAEEEHRPWQSLVRHILHDAVIDLKKREKTRKKVIV